MTRYIHVRNWWERQRFDDRRPNWFRVYPRDLNRDEDFQALTGHRRAVLLGLWCEYAENVRKGADDRFTIARGLRDNTATLSRRIGLRVTSRDLEALNHAGFIVFSEHELNTKGEEIVPLEVRSLRESEKTLAATPREGTLTEPVAEPDRTASGGQAREVGTGSVNGGRPRDLLWDQLETLFGKVDGTRNARGRRNLAVKDLRVLGATPELVRIAADRWPRLFPNATLTDIALATHYAQLTVNVGRSVPPCPECDVGGGLHHAECPLVVEPPNDLVLRLPRTEVA